MHPELAAEEKIIFCLFLNEHSNLSRVSFNENEDPSTATVNFCHLKLSGIISFISLLPEK